MDVFLKGIAAGLAVAAPVGPIGLLCIRRTLAGGRAAGLATGLGAASADAVYGVLVAAGIAVSGLLLHYAGPMKIGGGGLIALLGLMSIISFVRASPSAAVVEGVGQGIFGAYATTFALTISNPMTMIAFIGMVAGLGASASGDPAAPYWLVLGVFLGSALWWVFLVHVALAARSRLTPAMTRWLDLASGLVLLIWGLWIMAG